jgi:hypothetical protein
MHALRLAGILLLGGLLAGSPAAGQTIGSADIIDGSIQAIDIAPETITTGRILNETIQAIDLAPESITSGRIKNETIQAIDLAPESITSGRIKNETIQAIDLAPESITTGEIKNGTIAGVDLANGVLTQGKLDSTFFAALLQYASGQRIVFVTSETFTGDLVTEAAALTGGSPANGIEAGDMICQHLADANLNPAVLGTFLAWLSDSATDAKDRIHNAAEFQRLDRVVLSYSLADMLNNDPMLNTPNVDELGVTINTTLRVWTNTNGNGVSLNTSCNDWTSSSSMVEGWEGISNNTASWTAAIMGNSGCSVLHRLYCFQQ